MIEVDRELEPLVAPFLANRAADVERLRELIARGDTRSIQALGHNLLGVGGGYGFARVSELGAVIEAAARSGDLDAIAAATRSLADLLARAVVRFVPGGP